jgi:hypothetical protein
MKGCEKNSIFYFTNHISRISVRYKICLKHLSPGGLGRSPDGFISAPTQDDEEAENFIKGPSMKIDASTVHLSSNRVYFQKDELLIEKQMKFTDLLDRKTKSIESDISRELPDILSGGESTAAAFSGSPAVMRLQNQFLEELEKLRQILNGILKRVNAGGMSNGFLLLGGFDRVTVNLFPQSSGTLLECEYREEQTYTHHETENTDFFADGKVITGEGKAIDFSFKMDMAREFFKEDQFIHVEKGYVLVDPLVIHLDTAAPKLSEAKVSLDLNLDGKNEDISMPGQGSGFLALDINEDGIINDGSELFGPSTGEGFLELSRYDRDHNFWIDENDEIFDDLSYWGEDEQGEARLSKITDMGIGAIYLASVKTPFDLRNEDNTLQAKIKKSGIALNEDGTVSSIQEMDWTA